MEREGNMAEINPGVTETGTEIPLLPGYSRLTFQAENSIRKIDVPDNPLAQRKMLTDAMQLLESTQEENGNLAYSNANKTFVLMIQAMQQNGEKGPNDKKFDYNYVEQVKKLVDEHQARTAFHATFVAYETANDVGKINGALAQFKSEWLNKLFTDKNFRTFRYALEYYMDNGKNFVGMNEISAKAKQAIPELETQTEFRNKANSFVEEASKKWEEKPSKAEIESMRNLAERFFQFSLYVTVPAQNKEELNNISKLVESTLGSISITTHPLTLQMTEGFSSTVPLGENPLYLTHNMDTTSLATTFPFTTSELTSPEGVVYGINEHNDSLIIYDRFAGENANSVILATSGSGKSYFIKLEVLRSLMLGTDVIIIDPEKEYAHLAEAVGGDYINFSTTSPVKINPFDLPSPTTESQGEDELGRKILSLMGFLKLVLGDLNANETAMLDRAINATYRLKGITKSADYQQGMQLPLMEDLYKVLIGMEDAMSQSLALRLERFIKGSLAGIFSAQSNVQINNQLTVFSVRDLPESLRPLAMYLILDYIWTKIRFELKKRILIVDEAWYMMKYPDSAAFLVELVKRARKYYLGVTTISQDVEDFWGENKGKEIISNSAMQVLFKQAPVSIERIGDTFNLSQGERRLLLSAGVGRGIFFAGNVHVAMRVVASEEEHKLITTKPEEVIKTT